MARDTFAQNSIGFSHSPLMSKSAPVKKPEISRIIFFSIQKHDQNLYDAGHEFVIKTLFPIITNSVNLS